MKKRHAKSIGQIILFFLISLLLTTGCKTEPSVIGPKPEYAQAAEALEKLIQHEMKSKDLPALSISLVDDQEIVWAKGFGWTDPEEKIPATAETIYRIGSVSKMFTDIAIMQLVEKGQLDLDTDITEYLPDFRPQNPYGKPITLRQLMSHHSGLLREPPAGNYFDDTESSLALTIASLNETELVYEPGTRLKYSNAGVSVVGYLLEYTQGKPFPEYLKQHVLEPMGLERSAFGPEQHLMKDLATAYMWTLDGRVFKAPTFELGMAPAGCMYSSVTDLAKFISVLFNGGKGKKGRVLKPESLEEMWTPQFAFPGERLRFGFGFIISELEGYRQVHHDGIIYGFATQLSALPEAKLGVVVVTTKDAAYSVVTRIANRAHQLMLSVQKKEPLPESKLTDSVDPVLARRLEGRYMSGERKIDLIKKDGRLFLMGTNNLRELRSFGDKLIVDDPLDYGTEIEVEGQNLKLGDLTFQRIEAQKPEPVPERWKGLIGEYGWDHNILYILEREGKLQALIEWFFCYPLEEISENVFAFPDYGLYLGEKLIFKRDENGVAEEVEAAGVVFKSRSVGLQEKQPFIITPLKSVAELREAALAAKPPGEEGDFLKPELVDISLLDPSIRIDLIYASTNNFLQAAVYEKPKAFLQRPAAEALMRVHEKLKKQGYGLMITDAYQPWYVTRMFWDATPEDKKLFVADPAEGVPQNRGCAVELTLYELETNEPVEMTSRIDKITGRSNAYYMGGTSLHRWHRDLLRNTMEEEGFSVCPFEWWHFDYKDWEKYPILNITFEEILSSQQQR